MRVHVKIHTSFINVLILMFNNDFNSVTGFYSTYVRDLKVFVYLHLFLGAWKWKQKVPC